MLALLSGFSNGFALDRFAAGKVSTRSSAVSMLYGEPRPVQIIPSVLPADWANMGVSERRSSTLRCSCRLRVTDK
jgi:hypothetical protein